MRLDELPQFLVRLAPAGIAEHRFFTDPISCEDVLEDVRHFSPLEEIEPFFIHKDIHQDFFQLRVWKSAGCSLGRLGDEARHEDVIELRQHVPFHCQTVRVQEHFAGILTAQVIEDGFVHILLCLDDKEVLAWLVDYKFMQHASFPIQVMDVRESSLNRFVQVN